ncbi:hypothetical protein GE21DRAFT_1220589, partial [Neurospora crassa]
KGSILIILFPYINFINSFNIFYNSYYLLIGFYFIPAGLTINKHIRLKSIFLLILRLYNLKFRDVIKILKTIIKFDEGIVIDILGKSKIILYVFAICYTGDIP